MRTGVIYAAESAVVIAAAVSAALLYRPSGAEKSGRASKIEKFAYQSQVEAVSNYVSMATNSIQRVDLVGMTNYVDGATNAIPKTDLTPATNYADSVANGLRAETSEKVIAATNAIPRNVILNDEHNITGDNFGLFMSYADYQGTNAITISEGAVLLTADRTGYNVQNSAIRIDGSSIDFGADGEWNGYGLTPEGLKNYFANQLILWPLSGGMFATTADVANVKVDLSGMTNYVDSATNALKTASSDYVLLTGNDGNPYRVTVSNGMAVASAAFDRPYIYNVIGRLYCGIPTGVVPTMNFRAKIDFHQGFMPFQAWGDAFFGCGNARSNYWCVVEYSVGIQPKLPYTSQNYYWFDGASEANHIVEMDYLGWGGLAVYRYIVDGQARTFPGYWDLNPDTSTTVEHLELYVFGGGPKGFNGTPSRVAGVTQFKLYGLSIETNGVPARDFIPSVDSDGIGFLHDKVSGLDFYATNSVGTKSPLIKYGVETNAWR